MTSGAGVRPADGRRVSGRRRRPGRVDWAVAALAVLLQLLATQTGSPATGERPGWLGALATLLAVGQGIPLAWRRVYPYRVAGVVLGCYGGYVAAVGVVPPFAGWVAAHLRHLVWLSRGLRPRRVPCGEWLERGLCCSK